ncbi:hypothetical protein BLA29_003327 [Euroglyphus maynei]|uniref:Uncharacterized protein n=1 Tax=Euroglyphus maynei TaxID=6958 RepID=A0A1Y3BNY0_EURMA|nr:hypothetical protein BLA29_003327 [Euroglyphus maynei]
MIVITYRKQFDDQIIGDNDNIDDDDDDDDGMVKSFGTDEMSNMNRPLTAINNNRMANIIINVQRIILSTGGGGGGGDGVIFGR